MSDSYALTRSFPSMKYDDAVDRVRAVLAEEGFGVLTEIDIKATLKKKLDVDFRRYIILGACNPPLAHRALSTEPLIGVLLPCNVVVMENDDGGTEVAAFKPSVGFDMVSNPDVQPVAKDVEERLTRALDRIL
ncbi:MAG: DUF302 domain-containing protein [bacterium]|nr:DUF302 domain-containing protein [bacterium]